MKFTKYILFLLVTIFAVSCTIEDPTKGNGRFQIVSRIVPFDEHDVQTRAVAEDALNSLDYFIFANVGNETDGDIWACVFYKHAENDIIAIDRSLDFAALRGVEGADGADQTLSTLDQCRIVLVANYPGIQSQLATDAGTTDLLTYINDEVLYTSTNDTKYKTADYFQSITTPVEPLVGVPETGLPRVGDFGTIVNLSDAGGDAIKGGTTYTVNLKSLYAKMVFDISVDPTQGNVITGKDEDGDDVYADGNKFLFEGYDVYNLPTTVDMIPGRESGKGLADGTNDSTLVNKIEDTNPAAVRVYNKVIEGDLTGLQTAPRKTVFTCYLPERYLTAKVAANEYGYPFSSSGADAARDEDEKLLQRYKPEIAQANATFVRFYGTFYNHQGHSFDVSYDIYVGNDNYSNFDVVRNRQYNNIITIRGIDNSSDQSNITDEEGNLIAVSIDHRVNISRTLPITINFRRETLLDAHFEVRPLRIALNSKHTGDATGNVKVEVLNLDGTNTNIPNWIRLERSYGKGSSNTVSDLFCAGTGELGKSSAGKRKYFTYGLVSGKKLDGTTEPNNISANTSVTIPLSELNTNSTNPTDPNPNGCVWVYVDECLEASDELDDMRSALIRVTYADEVIDYVVNQHLLFKIKSDHDLNGNGNTNDDYYYIEHEEEYLYNFDADDNFTQNQTQFEGMYWGLDGTLISGQLTNDRHTAISDVEAAPGSILGNLFNGIIDAIVGYLSPFYDFYLPGDTDMDVITHTRADGYNDFCPKIIQVAGINVTALDEQPSSAIQYCYSRNKVELNTDGTVKSVDYKWYLPNILEIQEIVTKAYIQFDDFQNKFYWSCQPAYSHYHYFYDILARAVGSYMSDNIHYARATKYNYEEDKYYPSGMTGYVGTTHQTGLSTTDYEILPIHHTNTYTENYIFFQQTYNIPVTLTATLDEGYKHRTNDKCRVRAVRKMN